MNSCVYIMQCTYLDLFRQFMPYSVFELSGGGGGLGG